VPGTGSTALHLCNKNRIYNIVPSFSPDGRVLASPFAHSIRLLSFDDRVRDLSDCPPNFPSENPAKLHELGLVTILWISVSAEKFSGIRVARCYIFKPKIAIWVNFGGSIRSISWAFDMF
jgi:hypothetical protein